jgi:2-aminoadipate transaminase
VTLTPAERILLGEASQRLGIRLVEDDPYHDIWYEEAPGFSLAAVAPGTIVVGSFSKILAPGLRLGWMLVPQELIAPATVVIQASCLVANQVAQHLVLAWLRQGLLDRHVARLRAGYRERRDDLWAHLKTHCPTVRLQVSPNGGFFHWVGLPPGMKGERVAELALAEQVSVIPGSAFHAVGGRDDHLRLSFSRVDSLQGLEGARRLGRALARAHEELPGRASAPTSTF